MTESQAVPEPAAVTVEDSASIIALACAMAVQDAVAYLRNTEIIASAAFGAAEARILEDVDPAIAVAALETAQTAVLSAARALQEIGAAAAQTMRTFEKG
jgi:hypothetical protein